MLAIMILIDTAAGEEAKPPTRLRDRHGAAPHPG